MSDTITPGQEVTFTITKAPNRVAQRKTLHRLMCHQRHVQRVHESAYIT